MRRGRGFFSQQIGSAIGTARPVALHGAMAGRAGTQDFGAAARAEDEILLNGCAAVGTEPRCRLGFNKPHSLLNRGRARVMSDVMYRVMTTHRFYLRRFRQSPGLISLLSR